MFFGGTIDCEFRFFGGNIDVLNIDYFEKKTAIPTYKLGDLWQSDNRYFVSRI